MRRIISAVAGRRDDDSPAAALASLAALAEQMLEHVDDIAAEAAALIRGEVDFHAANHVVSDDELRESLRLNLSSVLSRLVTVTPSAVPAPLDLTQARATGRRRAATGVPLPAVMDGYRIGVQYLWRELTGRARSSGTVSDATLVAAASDLWTTQDELTTAMTIAYRDEHTARLLLDQQERSALVEALLEGRPMETSTLWEVAELLRIGQPGPYVVVAADLADVGRHSLPGIEAALRRVDITSAWRLTPNVQVGIVRLLHDKQSELLVSELRRLATTRVGVSPRYTDLASTAANLRLARVAMTGSIPERAPVTIFDSDALAVTAVAAPDITRRIADQVLSGLAALPDTDATLLLDTFEVWLDCNGSTALTASRLFCHENTVRQRLRRLERHTGRSLNSPRELTELCNALEVHRRLPPPRSP